MNILSLPPTAIGHVLSFLNFEELTKTRATCRAFHESATEHSDITYVTIRNSKRENLGSLLSCLKAFRNLGSVRNLELDSLTNFSEFFGNLTSLSFSFDVFALQPYSFGSTELFGGGQKGGGSPGPPELGDPLDLIVRNATTLTQVSVNAKGLLSFWFHYDSREEKFQKLLESVVNLKKLSIRGGTEEILVYAVRRLPHLEILEFPGLASLSERLPRTIAESGRGLKVITGDTGWMRCRGPLGSNFLLGELREWSVELSDASNFVSSSAICDLLKNSTKIETIRLDTTLQDAQKLFAPNMCFENLRKLSLFLRTLEGGHLGTLSEIASFLTACPSLTDLCVGGQDLTVTTTDLVTVAHSCGKTLQRLDIGCHEFSNFDPTEFLECFSLCTKMKLMSLPRRGISTEVFPESRPCAKASGQTLVVFRHDPDYIFAQDMHHMIAVVGLFTGRMVASATASQFKRKISQPRIDVFVSCTDRTVTAKDAQGNVAFKLPF